MTTGLRDCEPPGARIIDNDPKNPLVPFRPNRFAVGVTGGQVGPGWQTSSTKIVDNAVVVFCIHRGLGAVPEEIVDARHPRAGVGVVPSHSRDATAVSVCDWCDSARRQTWTAK